MIEMPHKVLAKHEFRKVKIYNTDELEYINADIQKNFERVDEDADLSPEHRCIKAIIVEIREVIK
jgi:hypothetical protein